MIDTTVLPAEPGCYLYKDASGSIIYIGKAKNLRKRVKSYFQKKHADEKTEVLVRTISSVDFIVTNTEVEALILENTLIKKHQPRFNINLKDSRNYAYIRVTDEPYPRILTARKRVGGGQFFGPFVSGSERVFVLEALRKIFQIRTCKKLPKKACLRYHIQLCTAPCTDFVSADQYQEQVDQATQVLMGKTAALIKSMNKQMHAFSADKNFEAALKLRDQIRALEYLSERQNMVRQRVYDEDIVNYLVKDGTVYLILFNINKGTLVNKQEFRFPVNNDFLEEFLIQYYSENTVPKELVVPEKLTEGLAEYLATMRESKVHVTVPKQGAKKQLLELVMKNIEIAFFGDASKVAALQKELKLNDAPEVIECFDISHLGGTATVGSMVQFRVGKPDKSNYRRFKIQTVEGIDDFASMAEVVGRRYRRLKEEGTEMPHLILIDGGKGQLHAALDVLRELEVKVPVISIAKRFEEIYVPGLRFPLRLDKKGKALKYLQEIRDEAHRFAITYNRLLRRKKVVQ